jgi:predicted RNase H-like nuclease (RuvC/YqgF family)
VRCVIAGKGTAWFDDVRLVAEQEHESNPPGKQTEKQAKNADQDALKELLEAHKSLLEINKTLAENARLLMEEIGRLRNELTDLKKSIETWQSEQSEKAHCTTPQPSPVPPFRPATRNKRGTPRAEGPQ